MSLAHLCNTFFEKELESCSKRSLQDWLRSNPIVLQLQFLPLLYAAKNDLILVSDLPENPDPRLCLLEKTLPNIPLETWGGRFGDSNWEIIRTVNSKVFSFSGSPKLSGAELLYTKQEVDLWIEKTIGPKVLKTAFGTAGTGHFHVGKSKNLDRFLQKQFDLHLPVIGEPWVDRIFDFSTQWKEGKLLGVTVFENDLNGTYKSTLAGPHAMGSFAWALEQHLEIAKPLVEKIFRMGFTGHLGIDAYIYGENKLQPVVEINGRKTMSWVALELQKNKPDRQLRFSYAPGTKGLLPSRLGNVTFTRQASFVFL